MKKRIVTGRIQHRLKAFDDDRTLGILDFPNFSGFFLCYSSKEASICKHSNENGKLSVVKRFFKVSAIKSILSNLTIQKIAIQPKSTRRTDANQLTLAILFNDDSLYIYENVRLNDHHSNDGIASCGGRCSDVSTQLTKHIHPIELRDLHGRYVKNHRTNDLNNSK